MKKLSFLLLVVLIGCAKDPNGTPDTKTFKDARDNHSYKYITIGTQTWMAENLAYLPSVSPSSDWSDNSPRFYVYNYQGSSVSEAKSKGNYTNYGVLYNWEAAKISCPTGWHLPTDAEWTALEDFLGALPGKKMKSVSEWSENGNGDNSSGFNVLPAGYLPFNFSGLGGEAHFWTATEYGPDAWRRYLYSDYDGVYRDANSIYGRRSDGYSVRCVKN